MRHTSRTLAIISAITLIAACDNSNPSTAPTWRKSGVSLERENEGCSIRSDVVVGTEAELIAALAAAAPGQVIGVTGNITVTADIALATPGITLTCATRGAGLTALDSHVTFILNAVANNVTVEHLVLDGRAAVGGSYAALNAQAPRFLGNHGLCGLNSCAFFRGNTPNAQVAGNYLESAGGLVGLFMLGGIDGARIEHNTVVQSVRPARLLTNFGGITVRDGDHVTIKENTVVGPFPTSLAATDLTRSAIKENHFIGAAIDGIRARAGSSQLGAISIARDVFRENRISGAGVAGIFIQSACWNTFAENDLSDNGENVGIVFDASSGANTVDMDDATFVVTDAGAFDCNADGVNDPNVIRREDGGHIEFDD